MYQGLSSGNLANRYILDGGREFWIMSLPCLLLQIRADSLIGSKILYYSIMQTFSGVYVMALFVCKLNLQRASLRSSPSHLCTLMVLVVLELYAKLSIDLLQLFFSIKLFLGTQDIWNCPAHSLCHLPFKAFKC